MFNFKREANLRSGYPDRLETRSSMASMGIVVAPELCTRSNIQIMRAVCGC